MKKMEKPGQYKFSKKKKKANSSVVDKQVVVVVKNYYNIIPPRMYILSFIVKLSPIIFIYFHLFYDY